MPGPEALESFVQLVEDGRTVEAMVRLYAEHASMRENMAAPRVGKDALIRHEEGALASIRRLTARRVPSRQGAPGLEGQCCHDQELGHGAEAP